MSNTELARVRRLRGLSQSALARRAGLARSTICKLESGTATGALETWWALGEALLIDYRKILPARKLAAWRPPRLRR